MYKGFNLTINEDRALIKEDSIIAEIKSKVSENKTYVRAELYRYLNMDGDLDGKKMQEDWFPEIEADVFISHAHKDEALALSLAAYLKKNFGLTSFIDSTVWGYSDDLLFSLNEDLSKVKEGLYDYSKCNYTASHVHMMLSVALNKMMNKCECLFFLNTPNSVNVKDIDNPTTGSAWIYSEIANSSLLERKKTSRRGKLFSKAQESSELIVEAKSIQQPLNMDHMLPLSDLDLFTWLIFYTAFKKEEYSLDVLYNRIVPKKIVK